MAAIDKLYVHSYYEYDDLRKWAITYYPELLFYFYNATLTYQQWENNSKDFAKRCSLRAKKDYEEKLGKSEAHAIDNLKKYYKEYSDYDCPEGQAQEEAFTIIDDYHKTVAEWADSYTFPVMSTPIEIDRKLLWICPVPCVRKYLEEQCGYKTHWYHKLFWRGKKHFS